MRRALSVGWICWIVLGVTPVEAEPRWVVNVDRATNQPDMIEVLSEGTFHVAVRVQLEAWTDFLRSFTTRERVLRYYLLTDWNGVDYARIYDGEVIGEIRVPPLKTGGAVASVSGITFDDRPTLTAPFAAGDYYVAACLPRPAGSGGLGGKLGNDPRVTCSDPVKLVVEPRPRPDAVTTFEVSSAVRRISGAQAILPGDKLILSARVVNIGDAAFTSPSRVRFYELRRSANRNFVIPREDREVAHKEVSPLGPGSEKRIAATVAGPGVGSFRYAACVDPARGAGGVREETTDNNCSAAASVVIQRRPQPCLDLAIGSVTGIEDRGPREGYSAEVTVENRGPIATTSPATVVFQRPGRFIQIQLSTSLLAAGAAETLTFTDTTPGRLGPAPGRVCVQHKEDCVASNNCQDFTIEIREE